MKNTYRLHVNVQIVNDAYPSGGLSVNEEILVHLDSFAQMASILEAFHTLVEQYKERSDAPKR